MTCSDLCLCVCLKAADPGEPVPCDAGRLAEGDSPPADSVG